MTRSENFLDDEYIMKQGVGKHSETVIINGWYAGGGGGLSFEEMRFQSKVVLYGEMGKDICPNLILRFFENIDRRSSSHFLRYSIICKIKRGICIPKQSGRYFLLME